MTTITISTADAKEEFSELVQRVAHNKERIILTRRDKEIAVIVPIEDLQWLQQSQNKRDLEEAVEALQEVRNQGTITVDDLKNNLG